MGGRRKGGLVVGEGGRNISRAIIFVTYWILDFDNYCIREDNFGISSIEAQRLSKLSPRRVDNSTYLFKQHTGHNIKRLERMSFT